MATPTLVIAGYHQGRAIYDAAPESKDLLVIGGSPATNLLLLLITD